LDFWVWIFFFFFFSCLFETREKKKFQKQTKKKFFSFGCEFFFSSIFQNFFLVSKTKLID